MRPLRAMGDSDAEMMDAIRARISCYLSGTDDRATTSEISVDEDPDILLPDEADQRIEVPVSVFDLANLVISILFSLKYIFKIDVAFGP